MQQEKSGLQIVEIEITNKCNLRCKHCYVDKRIPKQLDSKKVFEIIQECSNLNIHRLVFTGGEPLLVKELFDYAKYAKSLGIKQIVLMTNGLLINKKNLNKLKVFDIVQLSIDLPPGEDTKMRTNYNNHLVNTIDLLQKAKINVVLQATMYKSILPFIKKLSDFAKLKNVQIGFNRLSPVGEAKKLNNELLSPSELKKTLSKISKLKKENSLVRCSDPLLFLVDKDKQEYYKKFPKNRIIGGCIAGIAAIDIDAGGEVFPCAFLRYPVANIFNESLNHIWFNNKILNNLRRRAFSGKCGKCKYLNSCGGCRASSFNKTGSLYGEDNSCWIR
jgi:radical SAM protein with 4Fe4S-binding SPASM domain